MNEYNEFAGRSISDIVDEIIKLGNPVKKDILKERYHKKLIIDIPVSDEVGAGKEVYKCEECETMLFLYILQL